MRMILPSTSSLSAGMISPRNWLPGNLTTTSSLIGPNDMSHSQSVLCPACALGAASCRPDCLPAARAYPIDIWSRHTVIARMSASSWPGSTSTEYMLRTRSHFFDTSATCCPSWLIVYS